MTDTENNVAKLIETLKSEPCGCPVRTTKMVATYMLLKNSSVICGGIVFYFIIKSLGLGIYSVEKALSAKETTFLKK